MTASRPGGELGRNGRISSAPSAQFEADRERPQVPIEKEKASGVCPEACARSGR